jgi:hypothetical protein
MIRMTVCLSAIALAGCAVPACRAVRPSSVSIPVPDVIERVVIVQVPASHAVLLGTYAAAVAREHAIVPKAKAKTIYNIIALDAAARKALAPLRRRHHIATPEESDNAIAKVGALDNYVTTGAAP